ncbi:MAG: hypothetical protein O9327_15055 [Polaromonas sp.]|nr:hypothetical protein [Polaromonas sp.]
MSTQSLPLVATGLNQTFAFFADREFQTAIERVDNSVRLQIEVIALHRDAPDDIHDNAPRLVVVTNTHAQESYFLDEDIRTPGSYRYQVDAPVSHPEAFQAIGYLLASPQGSEANLNDFLSEYEAEASHRFSQSGCAISLPGYIDESDAQVACAVIKINRAESEELLQWARHGHVLDKHQLTTRSKEGAPNADEAHVRPEILGAIHQWADISLRSLGLDTGGQDQRLQASNTIPFPSLHREREAKGAMRCR